MWKWRYDDQVKKYGNLNRECHRLLRVVEKKDGFDKNANVMSVKIDGAVYMMHPKVRNFIDHLNKQVNQLQDINLRLRNYIGFKQGIPGQAVQLPPKR